MNEDPLRIIAEVFDKLVHHEGLHRKIDISVFKVANDHIVVLDDFVPESSVYRT